VDCTAAYQRTKEFVDLAMLVAEQWLADVVFWPVPVGPPGKVVACNLHYEWAARGRCLLDGPVVGVGKESDGLDTAAEEHSKLVPGVGAVVRKALAGGPSLELPLLVGIGVEASKATVAEGIAAVAVSCLEVDHGACLASQGEDLPVVADSYQEAEATLAVGKQMPCSQHHRGEDY
jgi:hypothetical protein